MRDEHLEGLENNLESESKISNNKNESAAEIQAKRQALIERFSLNIDEEADTKPSESTDVFSTSSAFEKSEIIKENIANDYREPQVNKPIHADTHTNNHAHNNHTHENYSQKTVRESIKEQKAKASNKFIKIDKSFKHEGGCLKLFVFGAFILISSILLSWYSISCVGDLLGLMKTEDSVTVSVPANADDDYVVQLLKDKGLIEQTSFFKLFLHLQYDDEDNPGFIEGEYDLNGKMGYEGMIVKMKYPPKKLETVRLTFPEGYSAAEIAEKLQENDVCTEEEFFEALNKEYSLKIATYIPDDDERYYQLEGYLFPDTYDFYIGENPTSVVSKFLVNTQNKFTSTLKKRADKMDMTIDEVMILASIIQKEASDPAEMGKVSSVFHNRLNKPGVYPNLQSDPTINYVEWVIKPTLKDESKFEMYAEIYNTYKCVGLPEGPICSPGIEAIRAALYPNSTSYYYFVTDNNDVYYYARTLSQHESNIAKTDRINEQLAQQEEDAA